MLFRSHLRRQARDGARDGVGVLVQERAPHQLAAVLRHELEAGAREPWVPDVEPRFEAQPIDAGHVNDAGKLTTLIVAQEIIVDNASYPTPAIERNSHDFRPLGLGYANLGALLMSWGVPYESERGRAIAAATLTV